MAGGDPHLKEGISSVNDPTSCVSWWGSQRKTLITLVTLLQGGPQIQKECMVGTEELLAAWE